MTSSRGLLHLGAWIALAAATHLALVWALPRVVMQRVLRVAAAEAEAGGGVLLPPPTDHQQRRIVMPSPDLMYALCVFDLRRGAQRVQFDGSWPHYWSIALYASQTDNFFVLNDGAAGGRPVDLLLMPPGDAPPPASSLPPGARVVQAPTERGLVLLRLLLSDVDAERASAESVRRRLRCLS